MEFRPCIDIHNGKVKQIVGGSLRDEGSFAKENFSTDADASFFAQRYKRDGIKGGHIILLNPPESEYYAATREQAIHALRSYPGGLQIGGGISDENAPYFLEQGASHVIVTSYVFARGRVDYGNLEKLAAAVGREHLVLDLSCRKRGDGYVIVTDRWQKFTDEKISAELLDRLSSYADEFLVHAVDVEGKASGVETDLVKLLGSWGKIPVTYAGGVSSFEDLKILRIYGRNRLNVTIGSALDLFGGRMEYEKVLEYINSTSEGEAK